MIAGLDLALFQRTVPVEAILCSGTGVLEYAQGWAVLVVALCLLEQSADQYRTPHSTTLDLS